MATYDIENFTIRTLLSPSIQIYLILSKVDDDKRSRLLGALINDDLKTIIDVVEDIIINTDDSSQDNIILKLNARSFLSELRNSFAHIRDLHYHKDDNNAMNVIGIVFDNLKKHGITNYEEIGNNIFEQIIAGREKRDEVEEKEMSVEEVFNLHLTKRKLKKSSF